MALLDLQGVSKSFGGLAALSNVDLQVEEGQAHAIIGPNGAGKSTLINAITGRLTPDMGSVTFAGQSLLGLKPHQIVQQGIARVFQTPEIFHDMTCLENVTIAALAHRDGAFKPNFLQHPRRMRQQRDAAAERLAEVGLADQREMPAGHLARGDKRRLELAICLANNPRMLLLDEPTAGMAQHETQNTIQVLKRIGEKGMTKIVIEHDMGVVFSLADKITVLHQGTVIASGAPEQVREDPAVHEAYLGGAHE
ncbi:amino acid/amide ABC transporter ATP-binding protein 1, HAAT family [Limimonas halophila]|uniref:Amino acid/amide ABC transporter ATP-binding protein 1, HAAT family n=1 Tax=Limimonas halophila TaxID=1082479 RepID=A0A1G7TBR9_9PROT|nr:ABC transporter ATP-binding protein [Limimonas halophila]SDG32743.1 amino acid/amide ABC transporter ATP-binding protein 1, HAAT family [Limimonas halophila]